MNNLALKSEIRRMLGSLQTSHPMIVAGDDQSWANRGVTDIVMMGLEGLNKGLDQFPELRCSWLSDLTVNAINHQSLPADKLIITAVHSFDSSDLPNANYDKTNPVSYMRPEKFDLITKDSSRVGWPRIWTMRGREFFYYPTPSASPTDYTSYLRLWGVQKDPYPDMSADDDTPIIATQWHPACVLRGAAIGARALGWFDKASEWDAEAKRMLGLSLNIGATEDAAQDYSLGVEGLVDRGDLYGGG